LPTTITILVSVEQATELAGYEKNASMHVALVYRGDEKTANKYISVQDKYLKDNHGGKQMAKLMAVYGSPGSGKTTTALKLAMSAYIQTKDESVVFLSPDLTAPSMALLFPNYHPDEICSLSTVLDNTEISSENKG